MSTLPVAQIDFVPLHERVYVELRQALMSGKFEPGQKLTSRKLAAALGTSDMPVRAAISRLTAEGGLVQRSNGTFIVPRVTCPAFKELMELRSLLEGRATSLACGRIDVDGLRRLHKYSDELDRAAAADDIVKYLDVNSEAEIHDLQLLRIAEAVFANRDFLASSGSSAPLPRQGAARHCRYQFPSRSDCRAGEAQARRGWRGDRTRHKSGDGSVAGRGAICRRRNDR